MDGKRTEVPATIGFEVDSTLLTVRAMGTDLGRGTTSRTASMNCRIPRSGPLALGGSYPLSRDDAVDALATVERTVIASTLASEARRAAYSRRQRESKRAFP